MSDLGSYVLTGLVAESATARVFRAEHVGLARTAAVKILSPQFATNPEVVNRFRQEAQLLADLEHPGIVDVFQFGTDDDTAWYAMEWIDGAPLDEVLAAHGPLTAEQSVGVVRHALTGLAFVHSRGVVHGDISLANIMLAESGRSLLVDFGIAAPAGTPGVYGTPAFASPEAASGGSVTARSDVYSAAAVLYTLMAGTVPLPAPDVVTALRRHREESPPALRGHGDDIARVLGRAMAMDPGLRHADAGALLADLDSAAQRRFGAGWVARASVAGLASGLAPAVHAMVAEGTPPVAPITVRARSDDASPPRNPESPVRKASGSGRVGAKTVLVGAGVVAVSLAGLAVVVASSGSDDGQRETSPLNPATSPTAAPGSSAAAPTPTLSSSPEATSSSGGVDLVFAGAENFALNGSAIECSNDLWTIYGVDYPPIGEVFTVSTEPGFESAKWLASNDGYLSVAGGDNFRVQVNDERTLDLEIVMDGGKGSVAVTGTMRCP